MSLKIVKKIITFVHRGRLIESSHEILCIIKNINFNTIFSTNNDNDLIFPRSSIKIFQALPFIHSLACKKFKLTNKEIAISCSSHSGEKEHLIVLNKWIKKLNISEKNLKCGSHNPLDHKSSNNLLLSGKKPTQLHNNCAGKHLGMLSGCLSYGIKIKNYLDYNHSYQLKIRKVLEKFTNCKILKKQIATDGCSAPQYAFTLNNLSIAMINLFKSSSENDQYTSEVNILIKAIKMYPYMIGGKNTFDSQLMNITKGKFFAKRGAEGVLLFFHKKKKLGGVIKVKDGNERALPSAACEIFKQLSLLNKNELKKLSYWQNQPLYNHAKIKVGEINTKIK